MKKTNWINRLHYLYMIIIIVVIFLLVELLFRYYSDTHYETHRMELDNHVQKSAQLIQESIMRKVYVVDTLKVILELTDYDVSKFEDWAPYIFEAEPGIASIQLAPDGIVSYIYPLEGNEKAIGHNLLEDKNRDDGAKQAIESEELTFIGPITLIQNGKKAIISRRPIFIGRESKRVFWGFSTVVINVEDIGFDQLIDDEMYNYRVIGDNPDSEVESIIYENDKYSDTFESEGIISVPGGQWRIQMSLKKDEHFTGGHVAFYLFGLLIALFFTWFDFKKRKQTLEIQKLNKELRRMSLEDDLTECHNRRYFEALVIREQKRAIRYNTKMSIIMLDIDFFKDVNDQYGHHVGDVVLKELAKIMSEHIRVSDDLARWGGEEFIILLPNTGAEQAVQVAEKLRLKIENNVFEYDLKMTASFGVAEYIQHESYDDLFKRVDSAVYLAKEKGRNQVVIVP